MVERYLALKRSRDAMDFADQMALAARLAMTFEDIGAIERQRFGAVLLDEFQDTSAAQLELLRSLFVAPGEPSPVTAVGDPHQSIYGWRGASATTLSEFRRAFGTGAGLAPVLPARDELAQRRGRPRGGQRAWPSPLRAGSRVPVDELRGAGRRPGRVGSRPRGSRPPATRRRWSPTWLAAATRGRGEVARPCCAASGPSSPPLIDALEARGIPHEVVGLGGLLLTPEVEDITALLHVVNDPSRGDQLMRLLTGPLCRLGAADLDGLMAWARHQQDLRLGVDDRSAPQDDDDAEGVAVPAGSPPPGPRREWPGRATGTTDQGPGARQLRPGQHRRGRRRPAARRLDQLGRQGPQRRRARPAARPAAGHPPAAVPVGAAVGRPRRRGRARPGPRHRGARPRGLHARARPGPTSTPSPTSPRPSR